MAYNKKVYVNNTTPAVSAANLNASEQGIFDAYYRAFDSVALNVIPAQERTVTNNGLTYNEYPDHSVTFSGTLSAERSQLNFFYSTTSIPDWITVGKEYVVTVSGLETDIKLYSYEYYGSGSKNLVDTSANGVYSFKVSNNAVGFSLFIRIFKNIPTAKTVKVVLTEKAVYNSCIDTSELDNYLKNCVLKNSIPSQSRTVESNGITFIEKNDHTVDISGSLDSSRAQMNYFYSTTSMPDWVSAGKDYSVMMEGFETGITCNIYEYYSSGNKTLLASTINGTHSFSLSSNAVGFGFYIKVTKNVPNTVTVKVTLIEKFFKIEESQIVEFNKDKEPCIIQNKAVRGIGYASDVPVVSFTHFSDIHRVQDLWNRAAIYTNKYQDYIDFAVMTGDYVSDNQTQYTDLISNGVPFEVPLYMCVGNHDTYIDSDHERATKSATYNIVLASAPPQDATFMSGSYSMTYYFDYEESNVRFIVLDNYYDLDAQVTWLESVLADALTNHLAVVTFSHEPTGGITTPVDCTFTNIDVQSASWDVKVFETPIASFISNGGEFIANFCGHYHRNYVGFTANEILNIVIPAATDYARHNDSDRVKETRTYDCFDIVGIDTNLKLIKVTRIGNNADHFLRPQNIFTYDYENKRVIANA